ncbi:MAG: tRNA (guanosine(46)-N7)-methyltransferase TrmB [Clostridia bacterium]|jgi:tRNA (guanine-N7-)-methyltransferase|nr:tRNA (guanosine(46)-N7)-methyltransferase TrmB [Clostridia bacterium]
MRIRYKKWARPELEACKFFIDDPNPIKGKWKEKFKNESPIYLELGCGKGAFISSLASKNLDINFIAVDLVDPMLGLSKRNIEKAYKEAELEPDNIILTRHDIERIFEFLSKEDKIMRIYINFCNPWPRPKHKKKRLTHTKQLKLYREFLSDNGEIYFKTDDDGLFEDSLKYFEEAEFYIINKTYNLHEENIFENNIETEHEKMFTEEGKKIKALIAKKKEEEING